jgi:LuxR family maltose regulon positive regulatory protein
LLQQRLSTEMTPDQISNMHRLASIWFEEHRLFDEALNHALAAGDLGLAARQMGVGLREVINHEDRPTLERWLGLLPEEMIQRRPELLMLRAWSLQFAWRLNLQIQVIQQLGELLDSEVGVSLPENDLKILRGQTLLLRAQQAYFINQHTRSIDLCQQVLALMPPSWAFVRGGAIMYLGMSMQASGQALTAEQLLLDEYESYSDKSDTFALFVLQSLGFIYLTTGQLEKTSRIVKVLVQGAIQSGLGLKRYWGYWFLGMVCYQRNELEAAREYYTQIFNNRYITQISPFRDAVAGLVLIHQIKGENYEAKQLVESISQYDLEQRGSEDNRTRSLRARLMLLQGDLESASLWADTYTDLPLEQPLLWLEEPQVTRVRILVTRGADGDFRLALQILDVLDEIADRTHNTRYKIEILALRALALVALGKTSEANIILKQAVDLAQPGSFIRVFIDLGKPMQAILLRLSSKDHLAEMIRRILAAFPEADKELVSNEGSIQSVQHPTSGNTALLEPLTHRELEVLDLLRGPLSIKEIALKLSIKYSTAKRYTIGIYAKLGVNQRWNAVARAEELNILLPR